MAPTHCAVLDPNRRPHGVGQVLSCLGLRQCRPPEVPVLVCAPSSPSPQHEQPCFHVACPRARHSHPALGRAHRCLCGRCEHRLSTTDVGAWGALATSPALPTLVEPRLDSTESFRLAEPTVVDLVSKVLYFWIIFLLKIIRKMKQRRRKKKQKRK